MLARTLVFFESQPPLSPSRFGWLLFTIANLLFPSSAVKGNLSLALSPCRFPPAYPASPRGAS